MASSFTGHMKIQDELRRAAAAAEKAKRDNVRKNQAFMKIKREMEVRKRAAERVSVSRFFFKKTNAIQFRRILEF